ncbi:putative cation exchanger YfkE [Caloramator mitchellensis]|uniref:Ca(2+)/H(+) antiporter n=1 Tax=Caloramator mitchellensis TaxID=908809 RepID=A0A0R3JWS3_CALMK|nr:calcium/proton exchanger [Caloramator mitchellensis]KRQ87987.1 putative cation exchanger YfkE [Caloramator mitchellensis]
MARIVLILTLPICFIFYNTDFVIINFILSFTSLILLSTFISNYTKIISNKLGDKIGGLINSTAGNLPELLISILAINHGMSELIKIGLIGSIIGNMLLVLGLSIFFGGIKYKEQSFNKNIARTNFSLLFLALTSLIITSSISLHGDISVEKINFFSLTISIVLIVIYLLGLIFSLITHKNLFIVQSEDNADDELPSESNVIIIKWLVIFVLVFILSQMLVSSIEKIITLFNIPEKLLGILIMPAIGNVAEYITAINMALKDKVSLCIEIAIGSSMQIFLFVLPLIVIFANLIYNPITLVYNLYDLTILILSVVLSFFVFQDGRTYWLEGAILLASYAIIILSYYLI